MRRKQVQYGYFRIGLIPGSPITARSESARRFDNYKKKSREILDWLINKGIITWCFFSHIGVVIGPQSAALHSAAPQTNTAGLTPMTRPIWKTPLNNTILCKQLLVKIVFVWVLLIWFMDNWYTDRLRSRDYCLWTQITPVTL